MKSAGTTQALKQVKALLNTFAHCNGDCAIERHGCRRLNLCQFTVKRSNLPPVGIGCRSRFGMLGRNCGLYLVWSHRVPPKRGFDRTTTLRDLSVIPKRPVLSIEGHQFAFQVHPGLASRVMQQHQRKQSEILGHLRHQFTQGPGKPHGLTAKLPADQAVARACCVPFVENQIQDDLYRGEPLRKRVHRRNFVWDARLLDFVLGPNQTLGQRRLRKEKCPRNLGSRQSAQSAERERNLRLHVERWVATGENKPKPVVFTVH
jgi:hypothetical protein